MSIKEDIHNLVDQLPERELPNARLALAYLRDHGADPLLRALLEAPQDEEGETSQEKAALGEAYADLEAGRVLNHEEARKRLLDQP